MKVARHLWQIGWLDGVDLFVLGVLLCSLGVHVVLSFVEHYTQAYTEWQSEALHWHDKALHYEEVVVSMLNGQVILNGRTKTVCLLNAAGDCETKGR